MTGEGLDRLAGKGYGHLLAATTELIGGERIVGVISQEMVQTLPFLTIGGERIVGVIG